MIGELRKRVIVQTFTPAATGSFNELKPAYTNDQPRWASIEPKGSVEVEWQGEGVAESSHIVTLRYYRGLSSQHRIVYLEPQTGRTRYFNILGTTDAEERHWYTVCFCKEVTDATAG